MAKRKARRVNNDQRTPTANHTATAITTTPPRVSPERVNLVLICLTVAGFAAIAADCWMSWEGFKTLPIDWWVAATLTAIVAASQLGSGIIQSLGGDPFTGVGGSSSGDGLWGLTLGGLYWLDIFSNFAGFGGTQYLNLSLILNAPGATIGLIVWNAVLAVLLAFGDEILFRLRDRIAIGAQRNQQLAKIREIQIQSHNKMLKHYRERASEAADVAGQNMSVDFDWIEGSENV
jgi:hypothetical protein